MVFQGINQGFIKVRGSTTHRAKRDAIRTLGRKMKTVQKNSAARAYLAFMAEAAKAAIETAPTQKPRRIKGGCLLYTMPNSRSQQHPPTPYYS